MRCDYLPQDIMTRVDNGIAFYQGKPVLVRVNGSVFSLYDVPGEKLVGTIPFNDPELDLAAPRLGWVNTKTSCFYVYRRPERRYKQTLQASALRVFNPMVEVSPEDIFWSKGFISMLQNVYPKASDALLTIDSGKVFGRAISKDVAIIVDSFGIKRVYLKTEEVGRINPGEKFVNIPKDTLSWIVSKYLEGFDWTVK